MAECHESSAPYVRNIKLDDVTIDQPLKITEDVPLFGFKVDLDDVTSRFKEGIVKAVSPYLTSSKRWVPWGGDSQLRNLEEMLDTLVKLNIDDSDSSLHFSLGSSSSALQMRCPLPPLP